MKNMKNVYGYWTTKRNFSLIKYINYKHTQL